MHVDYQSFYLLLHDGFRIEERGLHREITEQVDKAEFVLRHLVIDELSPNLTCLHVLPNVVHCSFKYLFALFLVLVHQE